MKLGSHMSDEAKAKISAALKGKPVSKETRAKRSASLMGNTYRLGSHPSEETRAKMSLAQTGHTLSPESRLKLSIAKSNPSPETRIRLSVSHKGIPVAPETRVKMSAVRKGHPVTPETRAKIAAARAGSLSYNWKGGAKVKNRRRRAKRRILGFTPLNVWFPGCEGHHVDNELVVFIPKEIHRSVCHRQDTGKGMAQMNAMAYNFLFKQEAEIAIAQRVA